MLGHELRNPLAAITNAVQVINASGGDAARAASAMSLVDRQTRNLRRIVDDLLDVARVTRGKIDLRKQPVDVMQIIGQAVDVVRPLLTRQRGDQGRAARGRALRVDGDLTRLEQSIVNLLLNAIKYTLEGRQIRIDRRSARTTKRSSRSATTASASRRSCCRMYSTCLRRRIVRWIDRRAVWVLACSSAGDSSSCTAEAISATSNGLGRGATFSIRLPLIEPPDIGDEGPAAGGRRAQRRGSGGESGC